MLDILIVDDQKRIRDGLQAMLRQFPMPMGALHCAGNGVEALELLRTGNIRLVITDIRMPDMDGLTLMARTREERIKVDYLIISGYSDFAYAQRAIELGAKGYLLKPVKREDLKAAVEHVIKEVETRQALSRSMQRMSQRMRETDRKELRLFMQGAEYDTGWLENTRRQNPALWGNYRLCLLRAQMWINQPEASTAHSMESVACRIYGRQRCLCIQHRPHVILALDADVQIERLDAALQAEQIHAHIALTDSYGDLSNLPSAYAQVMELYRHSYLFPERRCVLPGHIQGLLTQWTIPYEELTALFQLVGTRNSGKIAEGISGLFRRPALQRFHIRYTEELCRALVKMLEEYQRVIQPYMGNETLDIDSLRSLYDYPGIREYIQALQQQLLRMDQFYYGFKCGYRNTQDMDAAIRFIHENYHKPLDLAMVSNHVSRNYAYFSNQFKKTVGKGFAEYLRDVRMDRAKRLLEVTEHRITDVAAMVGYDSYKSFARAFRDAVGMQPTEYRQRIRKKNQEGEPHATL